MTGVRDTSAGSASPTCPHDMGFDRDLGPVGCRLTGHGLECVCEHMHFAGSAQAVSEPTLVRELADVAEAHFLPEISALREALEPFAKYEMIAVGFNGCFSKEDLNDCTWVAGFKGPQPEFRNFDNARKALAAQPPAAPVETATKSAPGVCASQNTAERPPSSDAAGAGADTWCSAGTDALIARAKEMPSSLNDACRTIELLVEEIARLRAVPQTAQDPLAIIEDSCWDIRCRNVPTGGDDYDIVWDIIEHYQAAPKERVVGTGNSPREALADATSALSRPHGGGAA